MTFTVVLLTYNRRNRVAEQINHLRAITIPDIEIIVVDNGSEESVEDLTQQDSRIKLIRNASNLGAVGRNVGMRAATGDYVVTLDDDCYGLKDGDFATIEKLFSEDASVAAINFLVLEEKTELITDWCHPRDMNVHHNTAFATNHISEGAVVFRKTALEAVGYYPDDFFISHEGPDLAFRLINAGFEVVYTPEVSIYHTYEQKGRASWRRYYYDTRNQLWLALRNYPFFYACKELFLAWGSVFIYAVRDGYVKYWFKGIVDGFKGSASAYRERQKPKATTMKRMKEIEVHRPSFLSRVMKRIANDEMRA